MLVVFLTIGLVGLVMAAMTVGVILKGRCLRGSCGGEAIFGPDGEMLNCETCPVRKEGQADLGSSA